MRRARTRPPPERRGGGVRVRFASRTPRSDSHPPARRADLPSASSSIASVVAEGELLHVFTMKQARHTITYRLKDLEGRARPGAVRSPQARHTGQSRRDREGERDAGRHATSRSAGQRAEAADQPDPVASPSARACSSLALRGRAARPDAAQSPDISARISSLVRTLGTRLASWRRCDRRAPPTQCGRAARARRRRSTCPTSGRRRSAAPVRSGWPAHPSRPHRSRPCRSSGSALITAAAWTPVAVRNASRPTTG